MECRTTTLAHMLGITVFGIRRKSPPSKSEHSTYNGPTTETSKSKRNPAAPTDEHQCVPPMAGHLRHTIDCHPQAERPWIAIGRVLMKCLGYIGAIHELPFIDCRSADESIQACVSVFAIHRQPPMGPPTDGQPAIDSHPHITTDGQWVVMY